MLNYSIESAHRAWLSPDHGTHGGRRRSRCLCPLCGEKIPVSSMFDLDSSMVCEDCVEENTFTYDVYPEYEDEHFTCCVCGELCEEQATLIGRDPYCKDCIREARPL